MFYDEIKKISWEETTEKIMAKTDADVRRALAKPHPSVDDFMAMVSPAADRYLEPMARLSRMYTRERFGNTINMFIPVYITNSCANSCVYCGFHVQNKMPRTILTEEEIVREYEAIKKLGPFDNLLVLTGENPAKAGVDYIARALDLAKPYFNNLQIEVMPLSREDYAGLRRHGLNGVICFQETYNEARYKTYHPRGPKSNYQWRINGYDRMGMAGVHKIGMGALIGLEDWRTEVTMLAYHLRYLEKTYWRTQYSVNFPRMRKADNGGFQPNVEMTDRELAQVTFAMRIFDRDVDISYSTRETKEVRNNMATLGVTTMSAESHTDPGGYSCRPDSLAQFDVSDERTAREVERDLKTLGMEPVWKNWDAAFDRAGH
ncbi:2-iminoacetate synthase ThiH [Xylanibacter muris]|uniref:2-iminoacetate synthase ThiH n=1 Tax=Xylanibacter muris TaxID=2736290 RepID=A0ABX2AS35_9BACT|nr:2-iminoacetate synthase ThiH [Xylanibacter muris]NPD93057.1 2-iminoacetate synthase ThiH [Xylanibacter muris]